ncbi:MAG: lysylphosphatidylglycerol synthase transmembrane domain-containing protein [Anaerolineales bacterium]
MNGFLRRWQFWFGLAVSALFLWLALRGLRLADVWRAIQGAQYFWLIPGLAAYWVGVWVRSWRWTYLLRPLKSISTRKAFPIVVVGYMGNNILPARSGELLRAYVLRRSEEIPISGSLATIVLERAFDGVVMLSFVVFNLPELARVSTDSGLVGNLYNLAILGVTAFLTAVALLVFMAFYPRQTESALQWVNQRLVPRRFRHQVAQLSLRFLEGLGALRSPRDLFMVLITSVVIWLLETVKYWYLMQAFPFEVSFFALMLMNGVVNLATTLPSAPGYIGTFDAPGIAVLVAYGVGHAVATGYTLVLHAALWLPITLLGLYYMVREGISWRSVRAEASAP